MEFQNDWEKRLDTLSGYLFYHRNVTAEVDKLCFTATTNQERYLYTCQWEAPAQWEHKPVSDDYDPSVHGKEYNEAEVSALNGAEETAAETEVETTDTALTSDHTSLGYHGDLSHSFQYPGVPVQPMHPTYHAGYYPVSSNTSVDSTAAYYDPNSQYYDASHHYHQYSYNQQQQQHYYQPEAGQAPHLHHEAAATSITGQSHLQPQPQAHIDPTTTATAANTSTRSSGGGDGSLMNISSVQESQLHSLDSIIEDEGEGESAAEDNDNSDKTVGEATAMSSTTADTNQAHVTTTGTDTQQQQLHTNTANASMLTDFSDMTQTQQQHPSVDLSTDSSTTAATHYEPYYDAATNQYYDPHTGQYYDYQTQLYYQQQYYLKHYHQHPQQPAVAVTDPAGQGISPFPSTTTYHDPAAGVYDPNSMYSAQNSSYDSTGQYSQYYYLPSAAAPVVDMDHLTQHILSNDSLIQVLASKLGLISSRTARSDITADNSFQLNMGVNQSTSLDIASQPQPQASDNNDNVAQEVSTAERDTEEQPQQKEDEDEKDDEYIFEELIKMEQKDEQIQQEKRIKLLEEQKLNNPNIWSIKKSHRHKVELEAAAKKKNTKFELLESQFHQNSHLAIQAHSALWNKLDTPTKESITVLIENKDEYTLVDDYHADVGNTLNTNIQLITASTLEAGSFEYAAFTYAPESLFIKDVRKEFLVCKYNFNIYNYNYFVVDFAFLN